MPRSVFPLCSLLLVLVSACSGDSGGKTVVATGGVSGFAGTNGAGGAAQGGVSGASGGAAGMSGGGAAGASAGASGAAGSSSGTLVCPPTGVKLASGACYIPCTYNGGAPPRYESPAANCSAIGWRCSVYQYCDPNIHCTNDLPCQTMGGSDLVCIPQGPLVGECLIRCNADADCPNSNGATTSPYACKPIDTGTGTIVHVCGF